MATTFITLDGSKLVFADTQAGLTTPQVDASCQISSATITAVPNTSTTAATMCAGAGQIASRSGYTLDVEFFQDWNLPTGFCNFTDAHDGKTVWFKYTLGVATAGPPATTPPVKTGQCDITSADFGGAAGDPLTATGSYPARNITTTAPTMAATLEEEAA